MNIGDKVRYVGELRSLKGMEGAIIKYRSSLSYPYLVDLGQGRVWTTDKEIELIKSSVPERKHSHYYKDVSGLDYIDVYAVCDLFEVDDPSGCMQHAIKKLLCSGKRGVKSSEKDLQEAVDTLQRKIDMVRRDNES